MSAVLSWARKSRTAMPCGFSGTHRRRLHLSHEQTTPTMPRGAPLVVPACDAHAGILDAALPDREVVREGHAPGVELLQPRDPRRVRRMRLPGPVETPGEERARVVG